LAVVYWTDGFGLIVIKGNLRSPAGVLVLDDCDPDFKNPPFDDVVTMFGPDGKSSRKVGGLNIAQTVGGCRSLSVSPDGGFFVVCENVTNQITAYETKSGTRLWSRPGGVNAAIVAPDRLVYALTSTGTIYGKDVLMLSQATGEILKQARFGGLDLALDSERKALWLVGKTIKKLDLDLKLLFETNVIGWCGVSVDVAGDGSAWVAERDHPQVTPSTNQIFKISATGQVMKSIGLPFSPTCLRVDRSDGSIWVTGAGYHEPVTKRLLESIEKRTGKWPLGKTLRDFLTQTRGDPMTFKFDRNGTLLRKIKQGGFTLDIDPTDGSLWIGGNEVYHYSREGKRLGHSGNAAATQKYVAVVPKGN
jgi:DNA-binding beta-propeller fold protein YncE